MQLLQFVQIDLHHLILALFWMLIHSLWQGLIAAATVFILLHSFKKASSQIRYGIIASCLLLLIISVTVTFLLESNQTNNTYNSLSYASDHTLIQVKSDAPIISPPSNLNIYAIADNLANKYANYLVLAWFICYLVYCIRFISGLIYINRLSATNLPVNKNWYYTLLRLQNELKINKTVRIFHSEKINVPVIIGAFKPLILIPVAVANQLPLAEIEAILLHELAHIKRNDFLINMIQTIIDQIFFFNPAVRWMSSKLREEREKCCDDMVLLYTKESDAYINALVRFQESMVLTPVFEMALGNNKFQLFKRIRRIINKENTKSTIMDKTIFFFSILSIATLGFMSGNFTKHIPVFINKTNGSAYTQPSGIEHAVFVGDTVPAKKEKIEADNNKAEIRKKVDRETREQIDQMNKEMEMKNQVLMEKKMQLEHRMNEYKLMNENQKIAEKDQLEELMKMKEGQLNAEKIQLEQKQMQLQQQAFQREMQLKMDALNKEREHMSLDQQKELDEKLMLMKKEAEIKNMQMRNEMAFLENRKNQQIAQQMEMQKDQIAQLKMEMERKRRTSVGQGNPEVDEIVSELLELKIIENTDPISFKLDSRRLIVNDKKQGQEIFNKFKEQFIHNSGDFIEYSHHGGSTSTTIRRD
jgi:Antirepressor regulating drug resistance, predicted signal transduction N-terminal membrane component